MTPEEQKQVRNRTIDEVADWLESCIQQVDHNTGEYKFGMAMVGGMRGKKQP